MAADGLVLSINLIEGLMPLMEAIVKKDHQAFAATKPGEAELTGLRTRITTIRGHYNKALQRRETVRNIYGSSAEALRIFTHDDPPQYSMPESLINFQETHTPGDPVQWVVTVLPHVPDLPEGEEQRSDDYFEL